MLLAPSNPLRSPAYRLGGLVLFAAIAVILAALAFEHIGGYVPCPLCLQQRYAYYAAIPLTFLALVLLAAQRTRVATALFAIVALAFLVNAGLGVYQAGMEWGFWEAPETCAAVTAPLNPNAGGLFKDLSSTRVARCNVPSWHFLGLSFAGWNVVTSLLLGIAALAAAMRAVRGRI